jgi:hypothetical protein
MTTLPIFVDERVGTIAWPNGAPQARPA